MNNNNPNFKIRRLIAAKLKYLAPIFILEVLVDVLILFVDINNSKRFLLLLLNFFFFTFIIIYVFKDVFVAMKQNIRMKQAQENSRSHAKSDDNFSSDHEQN